jgi:uncharacterized delta-60 repeat protein
MICKSRNFNVVIKIFILLLFVSITFFLPITTKAEGAVLDGSLDTSFQNGNYKGFNGEVLTSVEQDDGKILIGGEFTKYNGNVDANHLIRLNSDGSVDDTFDIGQGFSGIEGVVKDIAITEFGKIVVVGNFDQFDGGYGTQNIVVLEEDGSVYYRFDSNFYWPNDINAVAIQDDGSILVVGEFTDYGGFPAENIVRIYDDGDIDSNFNFPGISGLQIQSLTSVAIQDDGKILVGGDIWSDDWIPMQGIIRLNSDGSVDETFNVGVGTDGVVKSIDLQSDGKIIIGGDFLSYNGTSKYYLARLNSDGSLDTNFGIDWGPNSVVETVEVLSNDEIIIGGEFENYDFSHTEKIALLNSNGDIDLSFDASTGFGTDFNTVVYTAIPLSNGTFFAGGNFLSYNGVNQNYATFLNNDGTISPLVEASTGFDSIVRAIDTQSDGKLLVGGDFTIFNGTSVNHITRLNADGSLDGTFNVGTGANGVINSLVVQDDQKILIGGEFTSYNGNSRNRIVRLNSDGSIDTSFNIGSGANQTINSIAIQSDGKIIIVGSFTSYNGNSRSRIVRLNSDGSIDTGFNIGSGANQTINSVAIQSDGKILIVGAFWGYSGVDSYRIARLNTDGSFDNTFVTGSGFTSPVYTVAVQSDGKILVGGGSSSYNGVTTRYLCRINIDGSLDNDFHNSPDFESIVGDIHYTTYVWDIKVQDNEKILVGGTFTKFNDVDVNKIARLNADGSRDTGFDSTIGADNTVYSIDTIDNNILIGGAFTTYDSTSAAFFTSLTYDTVSPTGTISINSDDQYTTTTSVNLILSATDIDLSSGIKEMTICNDASFVGCSWESYSTSKSWNLTEGDEIKTVYVKFRDNSDNESVTYSDSITLESTPPVGSVTINTGDVYAENLSIDLTIFAEDAVSGVSDMMICNSSDFSSCSWESYSVSKSWNLVEGDGSKSVYIKFRDNLGNESISYSDDIVLDTQAPTGSLLINNDSEFVLSKTTTLNITASDLGSGIDVMMVCNSDSFIECVWEPYSISKSWDLSNLDGEKTVYIKFRDAYGRVSEVYEDSVVLDTLNPSGTIIIDEDKEYSLSRSISLNILATDTGTGVSKMMVCNSSSFSNCVWEDYKLIKSWTLESGDGIKQVYIKFKDGANRESVSYSDSIILETKGPESGSIVINNNASSTTSSNVTLKISATDVATDVEEMMICNNSEFSSCSWQEYSTLKNWILSTGYGEKTVYIKFKDTAGLVSDVYQDSIDFNAPIIVQAPTIEPEEEEPQEEIPEKDNIEEEIIEGDTKPEEIYETEVKDVGGVTQYAEFKVKIKNENNEPIANIAVTLNNQTVITDENGVATFNDISTGDHDVEYSYAGKSVKNTVKVPEVMGVSNGKAILNVVEIQHEDNSIENDNVVAWYVYVIAGGFILGLILFLILRNKKDLER